MRTVTRGTCSYFSSAVKRAAFRSLSDASFIMSGKMHPSQMSVPMRVTYNGASRCPHADKRTHLQPLKTRKQVVRLLRPRASCQNHLGMRQGGDVLRSRADVSKGTHKDRMHRDEIGAFKSVRWSSQTSRRRSDNTSVVSSISKKVRRDVTSELYQNIALRTGWSYIGSSPSRNECSEKTPEIRCRA